MQNGFAKLFRRTELLEDKPEWIANLHRQEITDAKMGGMDLAQLRMRDNYINTCSP